MHDVVVVVQPTDGGDDVTTYVAFGIDADHTNATAAFFEAAVIVAGASGGRPATTVVVAGGLVPSLFVPVTVMV